MQNTLTGLARRAIEASLKTDWKQAIEINSQILELEPKDIDAKVRLGRAYMQLGEFLKAKRLFKEVLETDPINPIALKNLKMASEKRVEKRNVNQIDTKSLLKEPGTCTEVRLAIDAKRIVASDFTPGEVLVLKIDKRSASIFKHKKDEQILIAQLDHDLVTRLNKAKTQEAHITASFLSGENKDIKMIIKSTVPVFKSERQDIRPYLKKGSIDEPELELPELEE